MFTSGTDDVIWLLRSAYGYSRYNTIIVLKSNASNTTMATMPMPTPNATEVVVLIRLSSMSTRCILSIPIVRLPTVSELPSTADSAPVTWSTLP